MADLNSDILKSLDNIGKILKDIKDKTNVKSSTKGDNITHNGAQQSISASEILNYEKQVLDVKRNITNLSNSTTKNEQKLKDELQKTLEIENKISRIRAAYAKSLNITDDVKRLRLQQTYLKKLEEQESELVKIKKTTDDITENEIKSNVQKEKSVKYIKDSVSGLFDMDKAVLKVSDASIKVVKSFFEIDGNIRQSARSIGMTDSELNSFLKTTSEAVANTAGIGGNFKDLTKFQSAYNSSIGRSVILSEKQQEEVAYMANGTILGADGAAEMASNFDLIGTNVSGVSKIMEKLLNKAEKEGVSGEASTKKLMENIKLAQSYNFANGRKALEDMAISSAKIGLGLSDMAGMSSEAFNVEGAVEMSAKLNVLGGSLSKIGDWSTLLYNSRDDVEALNKSVTESLTNLAKWDPAKKMYTISSMERQRFKLGAEAMKMDYSKMEESAFKQAKIGDIKRTIQFSGFTKKEEDLITGKAQRNDNGVFQMTMINGQLKNLTEVTKADILALEKQDKTLKERATQAASFDTMWNGIFESFKASLFPALKVLRPVIENFAAAAAPIAKGLAEVVGSVITFLGPKGTIIAGLIGAASIWAAKGGLFGTAAGLAFNSVTLGKGLIGNNIKTGAGSIGGGGLMGGAGSFLKSGGGLALAGTGVDLLNQYLQEKKVIEKNGEAAQTMNVGAKAAEWGGTGALIGSIIPGVGTAVGGIGGMLLGGAYGMYQNSQQVKDGVIRSDGSVTKIDSKDSVLAAKPGGPIDNLLTAKQSVLNNSFVSDNQVNNNLLAAKPNVLNNSYISNDNQGNNYLSGKIDLSPIKIEGNINVSLNGNNSNQIQDLLINDSNFIKILTQKIHDETRRMTNGGSLQPASI